MSEYERRTQERTELDERDRRALEEYLTVLDDYGRAKGADDLYMVVSQSGSEYLVDAREGTCECPDSQFRCSDIGCKHVRRVAILRGDRPVPADALDDVDVNDQLGEHIDASPTFVAADGGVVESSTHDGAEILESDDVDPFEGPFPEYDKYGALTGCSYVRCRDCGREALTGRKEYVTHRDGCQFADDAADADQDTDTDRREPTRSEPADFGHGESTGVIDL